MSSHVTDEILNRAWSCDFVTWIKKEFEMGATVNNTVNRRTVTCCARHRGRFILILKCVIIIDILLILILFLKNGYADLVFNFMFMTRH